MGLGGFMAMALAFQVMMPDYEGRKEELRAKWHNSKTLPRKKKKQARKRILLDWRINESLNYYNPFK